MRRTVWFPVFLFLGMASLPALAGNLVVVTSTAPGLEPGKMIADGAAVDLPKGTVVTLISETGKMITLKGPHSGPAGTTSGKGGDGTLVKALSKLIAPVGKESGALGAMRSAGTAKAPDSPWQLDVGRSGKACVPPGGKAELWRPDAASGGQMTLKGMRGGGKASVPWPAGSNTLAWPAGVTLKDGGTYLIRFKGVPTARRLTLYWVPNDLPTDAHRAAWMAEKGCKRQAKRLLGIKP